MSSAKSPERSAFTQILQPGQTLELVRAQRQRETLRRLDRLHALSGTQPLGQPLHRLHAVELPAFESAQVGEPRRVKPGQAQWPQSGVEQVDQGARQRLETLGRHQDAHAVWHQQCDPLVVADASQPVCVKPPRITVEQRGEQRRQGQALALHLDAHVELKPALLVFGDIGMPGRDL